MCKAGASSKGDAVISPDGVKDEATSGMGTSTPAVPEDGRVGASGLFQHVGKDRQTLKCPVFVDRRG